MTSKILKPMNQIFQSFPLAISLYLCSSLKYNSSNNTMQFVERRVWFNYSSVRIRSLFRHHRPLWLYKSMDEIYCTGMNTLSTASNLLVCEMEGHMVRMQLSTQWAQWSIVISNNKEWHNSSSSAGGFTMLPLYLGLRVIIYLTVKLKCYASGVRSSLYE